MSSTWIRGSRCNVDNCRTHYYKLINGQRICQYGHVYDGHVEYNDEEDGETGPTTKRLKIPNASQDQFQKSQLNEASSQRTGRGILYGAAGKELYVQCFQYILRTQAQKLMKLYDLPESFETVVKNTWIDYLTLVLDGNTNSGRNDDENDDDDDESMTSDCQSSGIESDAGPRINSYRFRKLPVFSHSLVLIYISCRYLQLPIYLNDIATIAATEQVPYMKATFFLPTRLRSRLHASLISNLEPSRPPLKGEIYRHTAAVISKMGLRYAFNFNYEPLVFKLVLDLVLPPRIFHATNYVLERLDFDLNYPESVDAKLKREGAMSTYFPEVIVLAAVMIATKLYFADPSLNKPIRQDGDPRSVLSFHKWERISKELFQNKNDQKSFDNSLKSLVSSNESTSQILKWDEIQTEKYLKWFETTQLDHSYINDSNLSIPIKRLFNLFKLELNGTGEKDKRTDGEREINSIKSAYDRLFKPISDPDFQKSDNSPMTYDELYKINKIFTEYGSKNFGLLKEHLDTRFKQMETFFVSSMINNRKPGLTNKQTSRRVRGNGRKRGVGRGPGRRRKSSTKQPIPLTPLRKSKRSTANTRTVYTEEGYADDENDKDYDG